MNKQQLIDNATKLGYQYEIHGNKVGFKKPHLHVWHWFDCSKEDNVLFHHSYSMNTGRTIKKVSHMLVINKRFGFYKDVKN